MNAMASTVETNNTPADPEMDRSTHLAVSIPVTPAPGADEMYAAALPLAVEENLSSVELYEVRKNYNRYLGNFIALVDASPSHDFPARPEHACNDMDCIGCQNKGARQADDGKNINLWGNGGL